MMRVIIPARLQSKRLSEKLIRKANGLCIIEHTINGLERLGFSTSDITVVTDSDQIADILSDYQVAVKLQHKAASCGSQRVHNYISSQKGVQRQHLLLWQGDEVYIGPRFDLKNEIASVPFQNVLNFGQKLSVDQASAIDDNSVVTFAGGNGKIDKFARGPVDSRMSDRYLHLGIYLFEKSFFERSDPGIWDNYQDDIEMNAVLSQGDDISFYAKQENLRQTFQINTETDLERFTREIQSSR